LTNANHKNNDVNSGCLEVYEVLVAPLVAPVELLLLQTPWQVMNGEIIDYKLEYI